MHKAQVSTFWGHGKSSTERFLAICLYIYYVPLAGILLCDSLQSSLQSVHANVCHDDRVTDFIDGDQHFGLFDIGQKGMSRREQCRCCERRRASLIHQYTRNFSHGVSKDQGGVILLLGSWMANFGETLDRTASLGISLLRKWSTNVMPTQYTA